MGRIDMPVDRIIRNVFLAQHPERTAEIKLRTVRLGPVGITGGGTGDPDSRRRCQQFRPGIAEQRKIIGKGIAHIFRFIVHRHVAETALQPVQMSGHLGHVIGQFRQIGGERTALAGGSGSVEPARRTEADGDIRFRTERMDGPNQIVHRIPVEFAAFRGKFNLVLFPGAQKTRLLVMIRIESGRSSRTSSGQRNASAAGSGWQLIP